MKQLTKSLGSLSWALPLFGFEQMSNALRRSEDGTLGGDAVTAMDAVTRTSLEQCGTNVRQTFETGDKMQRDLVDMVFRLVPACDSGASDTETSGSCAQGSCLPGLSGAAELLNPIQMMRRFTRGNATESHDPADAAPVHHQSEWGPAPPSA